RSWAARRWGSYLKRGLWTAWNRSSARSPSIMLSDLPSGFALPLLITRVLLGATYHSLEFFLPSEISVINWIHEVHLLDEIGPLFALVGIPCVSFSLGIWIAAKILLESRFQ